MSSCLSIVFVVARIDQKFLARTNREKSRLYKIERNFTYPRIITIRRAQWWSLKFISEWVTAIWSRVKRLSTLLARHRSRFSPGQKKISHIARWSLNSSPRTKASLQLLKTNLHQNVSLYASVKFSRNFLPRIKD